jgi:hypothetical protein
VKDEPTPDRGRESTIWARLSGPWPAACAFVLVGLFVFFGFGPLFEHHATWYSPDDTWTLYQGGLRTAWGDFGDGLRFVSAPGTALLMAPPAFVGYHLGLQYLWAFRFQSPFPEPEAWLVLGPWVLVLGATIIFAVDHLVRCLGANPARRTAAVWLTAGFAAPVVIVWGHPEDVVAMALAVSATSQALAGRWGAAGWLFGLGFLFQPLCLLIALPILSLTELRTWWKVLVRIAAPTVMVMAVGIAQSGGDLSRFAGEPNWIKENIASPLLAISPSAGPNLVSTALWRALALVAAALIGLWARHRRAEPLEAIWFAALALSIRFALEPVETAYYLWPAVALLVILIAVRSSWLALAPLSIASAYACWRVEEWAYWIVLLALLIFALALVRRSLPRGSDGDLCAKRVGKNQMLPEPRSSPN